MTHYLEKRGRNEVPFVFPITWIHQNDYVNNSEKNRYEKMTELFLKLKFYIERDEGNEKQYIKEFMIKNGIYNGDLFTIDKLTNFMNFLNSKMVIDPSKSLKEIITKACSFKGDDEEEIPRRSRSREKSMRESIQENNDESIEEENKLNVSISKSKIFSNSKKNINSQNIPNKRSHFTLSVQQNKNSNLNSGNTWNRYCDKEEDRYNMSRYLSHPQPILGKKFKVELNNPQAVIKGLETEFARMKGLNFGSRIIINDFEGRSSGRTTVLKDKIPVISNNAIKEQLDRNARQTFSYSRTKMEHIEKNLNREMENDIELIKKKNKLLEYIILQRSKSKLVLEIEKKKFNFDDNDLKGKKRSVSNVNQINNF
jgi:hypothetical protein